MKTAKVFSFITSNLVFIIAAIVLFLKTSEVLAAFAPRSIFGFTGVEVIYGVICALLVEGVMVTAKFSLRDQTSTGWLYNVGLLIATIVISGLAQVVDGNITRNNIDTLPVFIQFVINVGIPLIPTIVLIMVVGRDIAQSIPEETETGSKKKQKQVSETRNGKFDWRRLSKDEQGNLVGKDWRQISAIYPGLPEKTARNWEGNAKGLGQ